MNKDNLLFGIVGLLLGLIIGFMVTNSLNSSVPTPGLGAVDPSAALPADHPSIAGQQTVTTAEVQAAVDAAAKQPGDFSAQVKAAEMNYQVQRYDKAVEFFTNANKLKPGEYEVIVKIGNASFDGGKFEEAEIWYQKALAKKSDDVNVRTDLGLTFILRAPPDYDRAIKEFLESLEIKPNHPQTLQNLVVGYTKKGDAENAKSTLAKFETIEPTNTSIPKLREEIQKIGK